MINKAEIRAPFKPSHYIWLSPIHYSMLFSSYKNQCITVKFVTHSNRLSQAKGGQDSVHRSPQATVCRPGEQVNLNTGDV